MQVARSLSLNSQSPTQGADLTADTESGSPRWGANSTVDCVPRGRLQTSRQYTLGSDLPASCAPSPSWLL